MNIGITMRLDEVLGGAEIRASLDVNWFDFLKPLSKNIQAIPTYSDYMSFGIPRLDMIILTGGNDLNTICKNRLSKKRDRVEYNLIDYALQNDIALVGICRGMQVINTYFGGTLSSVSMHVKNTHVVTSNAKWLAEEQRVNSFHHWGVTREDVAKDLAIKSISKRDETVEAIEHKSLRVRGVMWHPERWQADLGQEEPYYRMQRKIFEFQ